MNLVERKLAAVLFRSWWVLLVRGLAAIAFAILTWFQPGITLAGLVLLFGAYAAADGLLALWAAVAGPKDHESWWLLLLEGLLGIGVGVMTFMAPGITAFALLLYIAVWAIATGVLELVAAIRLRKEIESEWLLVLGGLASVVFGVLLMAQPAAGALALLWLIAGYAALFGLLLVTLGFKARKFGSQLARS